MINTEIKIDEVAMEIKLSRQLDYVNAPELDKAARRKAYNRKENRRGRWTRTHRNRFKCTGTGNA